MHANSTQEGPSRVLNPGPLTVERPPPCSLILEIPIGSLKKKKK